jgi:hypothetical protein
MMTVNANRPQPRAPVHSRRGGRPVNRLSGERNALGLTMVDGSGAGLQGSRSRRPHATKVYWQPWAFSVCHS